MSKGISGLFHGTHGEKVANAIKTSVQKDAVTSWSEHTAERLAETSKRQRDKFRTACVAVDEETGKMYFRRNGGIDRNHARHNPVLFGNDGHPGILPRQSLNAYPTPWNCAESDAINAALNAGARLENIHIYTIGTGKKDFGKPKPSCLNCTSAYKGRIRRNNTGWAE